MKTILIAGATDGIGLAFLKQVLQDHSFTRIFALGRNFTRLQQITDQRLIKIKCDISREREVAAAVRQIPEKLDIFVSTIGTFKKMPVKDTRPQDVQEHFQINVIANISLLLAILPKLNRSSAQIMVCLASLALKPKPAYALQSATKVAYKYFLDVLRMEQGKHLRVITVFPPSINTGIFAKNNDFRDTSKYPDPSSVAKKMLHAVNNPQSSDEIKITRN